MTDSERDLTDALGEEEGEEEDDDEEEKESNNAIDNEEFGEDDKAECFDTVLAACAGERLG